MQTITIEQDEKTREQLINIQAVLLELKEDIKFLKSQLAAKHKGILAERYYSVNEVCKLLGISNSTLYNWIKELKFPTGQLIGNSRRFCGAELQAWIENERR